MSTQRRKRPLTPNEILLEGLLDRAESAYTTVTGAAPAPTVRPLDDRTPVPPIFVSSSSLPTATSTTINQPIHLTRHYQSNTDIEVDELEAGGDGLTGLGTIIENPLAVLAHIAEGSAQTSTIATDEEQGRSSFDPKTYNEIMSSDQYFSTGLYEIRPDVEPELDPVHLGILSHPEFSTLLDFYFDVLHPSSLFLNRTVYTAVLSRDTSTFLTTVLAYVASSFSPNHHHLLPALEKHSMLLADVVYSKGYKSRETVEAFCLLAHWAPMANNWGSDRQWAWLGQAVRTATELRMDKDVNQETTDRYNSLTTDVGSLAIYREGRRQTWALLFMAEISLCVSTGRLGAIVGLNLVGGFRASVPVCPPSDPNYEISAMEALYRIYAKALVLSTGLRDEATTSTDVDLRLAFNTSRCILLAMSLKFAGPKRPIFHQCRAAALEVVRVLSRNSDPAILYAGNALVSHISYAATLLARFFASSQTEAETLEVIHLVLNTIKTLESMAAKRPTLRTAAGLNADRLRTLLTTLGWVASESRGVAGLTLPFSARKTDEASEFFDLFDFAPFEGYGSLDSTLDFDIGDWTNAEPGTVFW
ncbi:Zn(2)-C6 fungal-type transcription factor [Pseudohyphozyma bogoriensis]|nr:Zn(2)-C6 fungal-type transcription factor [Pseudohyphozyma bogoriensis]